MHLFKNQLVRPLASQLSAETFDVIVIGGGITGAGVAQDAASRGLKVLLLEKGDFASGTSSKSTKLIHGGLRYLQNMQFMVTLESVRERQLQQQLAPHLVWGVPFIIPKYEGDTFKNVKLGVGLWVYDLMAGLIGKKFHRTISRHEVLARCPGIKAEGLTGGFLYWDCRTDDARHVLEVIKSACANGATAMNYVKVVDYVRDNGKIVGVDVVDMAPGEGGTSGVAAGTPVRVRGRVVVNATGVWTQQTSELGGGKSATVVVPAKGVHITVPRARLPIHNAMIVPSVHDKRFCFAVPWYDAIVIGTTDTEYKGDIEKVVAEEDEIQYILDAVNAMFPQQAIKRADVSGSFAGLRPLIRDANKPAGSTADLSRQHSLHRSDEGLVSIAGGKLTTYRPMAKETVDLVVKVLKRDHAKSLKLRVGASRTHQMGLSGFEVGDNFEKKFREPLYIMCRDVGLSHETALYLPTVYGCNTPQVLDLVIKDPSLAKPLSSGHPYVMAQVAYAVKFESAVCLDDILSRRIRLTITDQAAAEECAERAADILAHLFSWTSTERLAAIESFRKGVR